METRNLRTMARETAELALQLAALPADGLRTDAQALSDLEHLAARILKEASTARAANRVMGETRTFLGENRALGETRAVGETRGIWRVMQPARS
jgi:hypothetical protein